MQMLWTDSFKSRILFNASKAYVRQLDKGIEYKGLQPVYALSLINEIFESETSEFYHHYKTVHVNDNSKTIEGLQLIFVELPKFKLGTFEMKKLKVSWLRYLSEIQNGQEMLSQDLLNDLNSVDEIADALELTKESGYTKVELEAYEKYWDTIRTERTLIADAEAKGKAEGEAVGELKEKIKVIKNGYVNGIDIAVLAKLIQLTEDEVKVILKNNGLI